MEFLNISGSLKTWALRDFDFSDNFRGKIASKTAFYLLLKTLITIFDNIMFYNCYFIFNAQNI